VTNYVKATDFAAKDNLVTGNPNKIVKGSEINAEFAAIQVADATSVKGPVTATTDNALARFDGVSGYLVQNSAATIDDSGNLAGVVNVAYKTGTTGTVNIPSGTTAQRSTVLGVGVRYNTDLSSFEGYNGSAWGSIGGGATGGGSDTIFQANKTVMTTSYTLPASYNASTVGPLTINSGVSLTIPSGQRMVVL